MPAFDPNSPMRSALANVRWNHEQVIDMMVAEPKLDQNTIARHFGYSAAWVSTMINSDAFQAALACRKEEIVNPALRATVEARFKAIAQLSLDRMIEKLSGPIAPTDAFILKSAELAKDALGYGARNVQGNGGPQVAVIVNVPAKATQDEWVARYTRGASSEVVDVAPTVPPPAEPK